MAHFFLLSQRQKVKFVWVFLLHSLHLFAFVCATATTTGETTGVGVGANKNYAYPQFNIQDLANLMEMFPEFRNYVLEVLKNHAGKVLEENGGVVQAAEGNVRRNTNTEPEVSQSQGQDVKKLGWGWDKPKLEYHPHHDHHKDYGYKGKGYGWSSPGHFDLFDHFKSKGWSWSPPKPSYDHYKGKGWNSGYSHDHHHHHHDHHKGYGYGSGWGHDHYSGWGHELYKDPKFHYQVGYDLGKDLSCILGFFGLKSIKDITVYSVFTFLKKLKVVFLIMTAFKLGLFLSPFALPMLFPIILTALAAKMIPLILIICLLIKLLKTQLKFGLGGREHWDNSWGYGYNEGSPIVQRPYSWRQGMPVNRLLSEIESVTMSVVESEKCVDGILCNLERKNRKREVLWKQPRISNETGRPSTLKKHQEEKTN